MKSHVSYHASFWSVFLIALAVLFVPVSGFGQDSEAGSSDNGNSSTTENTNSDSSPVNPGIDESTIILNPDIPEGETGENTTIESPEFSTLGIFDYLRMLLVLGVIIVVIYAFFYILKKYSNRNLVSNDLITIMGTQVIKGDTALHIVELGNNYYLVGSGSGNVSLIDKIEDKETLDQIKLTIERRNAEPKANFRDILFSKINIPLIKPSVKDSVNSGLHAIRTQRENLRRYDPEGFDTEGGEE